MDSRCNVYERAIENNGSASSSYNSTTQQQFKFEEKKGSAFAACTLSSTDSKSTKKTKTSCFYCEKELHYLHRCHAFQQLAPLKRTEFVIKKMCCRYFRPKSICKRSVHIHARNVMVFTRRCYMSKNEWKRTKEKVNKCKLTIVEHNINYNEKRIAKVNKSVVV